MFRIRSVAAALFLACTLTGCGAAIYGAVIAAIVSQKTTTTTKTSAPLSQPTVPIVPGYAILALSSSTTTVTRNGAQVTDFKVVGLNFPSGFGSSISNRDTDRTLVASDVITIRINQDATQQITFGASDVTSVGTQVAATIQAKVQALKPQLATVDPVAYSAFSASYDPTTGSYRFVSGSPGDTSEVVFEPKPRSGIDTVKPTTASTATATRLGLGTAQGGIETSGAESVLVTILNSGTDSVSQGATVDLFISHSKTLDATAIKFDTISVPTAVAVGQARRMSRTNADALPATVVLQDIFPGGVNTTTGLPAQPVGP
ncbi:MAG TPA: hypothetical protein VFF73_37080, partial [Planctomycetota bacterium]|nr:hypothetical protein [Planctomycetota bacterium]